VSKEAALVMFLTTIILSAMVAVGVGIGLNNPYLGLAAGAFMFGHIVQGTTDS